MCKEPVFPRLHTYPGSCYAKQVQKKITGEWTPEIQDLGAEEVAVHSGRVPDCGWDLAKGQAGVLRREASLSSLNTGPRVSKDYWGGGRSPDPGVELRSY